MAIDYKKYLPAVLRKTKWGSIIEAFQSVIGEVRTEKIDAIFRQMDIYNATDEEKKEIAYRLGFNLLTLSGYTETSEFLKREIQTITDRIKWKNTERGYKYISYIFNLIGNVYATVYDAENYLLLPVYDYSSLQGGAGYVTILDQEADNILYIINSLAYDINYNFDIGYFFDTPMTVYGNPPNDGLPPAYLDTAEFQALDLTTQGQLITRHMIYDAVYKTVETATEFLSDNTLKVLWNDLHQMKRKTELLYFQPHIVATVKSDHSVVSRVYYSYDGYISAIAQSILIKTELTDIKRIRFGNSSQPVSLGVTDVDHFIFELKVPLDVCLVSTTIPTHLDVSMLPEDKDQSLIGYEVTEMALWDSGNAIVAYFVFPKIKWHKEMYNAIRIDVTIT